MTLVDRVRDAIERQRLVVPSDKVVVGVSGGPDSVCMLHILRELSPDLSLGLHVAHLNHMMRGKDADADAAFVARLARDWNLPATIDSADVFAFARTYKLAPEEAARRVRYVFLAQVAVQVGARTIAVAHNADDQTETVLMHWLRGAGLAGLRGMLPSTPMGDLRLEIGDWRWGAQYPIPNLQTLVLIRPLLGIPRPDIEAYCDRHNLQPRFDRSNLDTTYFRNRLRRELIPYLETYNANIREVVRRSASVVTADYEVLRERLETTWAQVVCKESEHGVTFDLAAWRALPLALRRSTIREAIHRLRRALRNIDFVHVENAVTILTDGETGAQGTLPQGLLLTIGYSTFSVADENFLELPDIPLLMSEHPVVVTVPGKIELPESAWVLKIELLSRSEVSDEDLVMARGWEAYLDASAVGATPSLRPRRPGDRFCPLGMGGRSKRVNEFMINEKIPAAWRDRIPMLVNENGKILWVCGWRVDERACITKDTQKIIWLRFVE